jgi:hypothetical protein
MAAAAALFAATNSYAKPQAVVCVRNDLRQHHLTPDQLQGANGQLVSPATVCAGVRRLRAAQKMNQPSELKNEGVAARTKFLQARTRLAEIEAQKRAGEIIEIADAVEVVSREFGMVRERLLSVPAKVAINCEGKPSKEIEEIIRDEIWEALRELSYTPGETDKDAA